MNNQPASNDSSKSVLLRLFIFLLAISNILLFYVAYSSLHNQQVMSES